LIRMRRFPVGFTNSTPAKLFGSREAVHFQPGAPAPLAVIRVAKSQCTGVARKPWVVPSA
jgi:hypothetical protein